MSFLNDLAFGQHCEVCKTERTKRVIGSKRVCMECARNIAMNEESQRLCPVDGHKMKKVEKLDFFIDVCPKCEGIWFDKGELEEIEKRATSDDRFVSGLLIGAFVF